MLHDYAGIPGSEAAVGLGRSSNLVEGADNNEGAVIKLIYLAAWLPLERQFHPELAWLENMESMEVVDEKVCIFSTLLSGATAPIWLWLTKE